jgi:hypothetical protein
MAFLERIFKYFIPDKFSSPGKTSFVLQAISVVPDIPGKVQKQL